MKRFVTNLSLMFAAGSLGGLINSFAIWGLGDTGVNAALGVSIKPTLTLGWLYPRVVWGGLWGFLFLLPMLRGRTLSRGFLLSLAPSAVQLFVVFPYKAQHGMLGLELGVLSPVIVLAVNAVWGISAAIWLRAVR